MCIAAQLHDKLLAAENELDVIRQVCYDGTCDDEMSSCDGVAAG